MEQQKELGIEWRPSHSKWIISQAKCTGCRRCLSACTIGLLKFKDDVIYIDGENYCNQCGDCSKVCGARAISFT